jgi:hypothetical protein
MTMRRPLLRPMATLIAAVALLLAGTVVPASAHSDLLAPAVATPSPVPVPVSRVDETGASVYEVRASDVAPLDALPAAMSVLGVCLAVAVLNLLPRRRLPLGAAAFTVLLTIAAFETAVHAVHHLGDAEGAARCVVASVASHVSGTADPPHTDPPSLGATESCVALVDPLQPDTRPLGPRRGRAPPSIAS